MWQLITFLILQSTLQNLTLTPNMQEFHGISGICRSANGRFWAIPESQRSLLPLTLNDSTLSLSAPITLTGVGRLDTEAIACTEDGFVLGTEGSGQRRDDALLFVALRQNQAT